MIITAAQVDTTTLEELLDTWRDRFELFEAVRIQRAAGRQWSVYAIGIRATGYGGTIREALVDLEMELTARNARKVRR